MFTKLELIRRLDKLGDEEDMNVSRLNQIRICVHCKVLPAGYSVKLGLVATACKLGSCMERAHL
jgi:hypothetical protein